MRPVDSRCSRCNSPDEALHVGESGMALRRPIPENSEITDTHTQNTSIIIIDGMFSAQVPVKQQVWEILHSLQ